MVATELNVIYFTSSIGHMGANSILTLSGPKSRTISLTVAASIDITTNSSSVHTQLQMMVSSDVHDANRVPFGRATKSAFTNHDIAICGIQIGWINEP